MKNIPTWQYDESNHPGEDFDIEAEIYDDKVRKFRDIRKENEELLAILNLQSNQIVLEIGAGTGEFALAAARQCLKVIAVDTSSGMLRLADNKARSMGIENIEFIQSGFLTYDCKEPVDVAVSLMSLHYLPDFWKQIALFRLSKMTKEGATLLIKDSVYSFDIANYVEFFNCGLSRMASSVGNDSADWAASHIKEEHSTLNWIMEGMIKRAGFRIEKYDYMLGMYATYLCTKVL